MDKKFIGTGFTFAAVDDGLKNFMRNLSNQFNEIQKGVKDAGESAEKVVKKDSGFGKFMNFFQMRFMSDAIHQMKDFNEQMLGKKSSDELYGDMQEFFTTLEWTGKKTGKQVDILREKMFKTAQASGIMPENFVDATKQMMASGVAIEDIEKNLGTIGNLMGVFKMEASDTAKVFASSVGGQLKMTAEDLNDLVKSSVSFSQSFGVTPNLKAMDKILGSIETKTAFKGLTGKGAKDAAMGVLRLQNAFRTLNKDAEPAADLAVELFENMKSKEKSFANMMSGLESNVDGFYNDAFVMGSKKAKEAMLSNDPTTLMEALHSSLKSIQSDRGLMVFRARINETFGSDTLRLVENWDKARAGLAKSESKSGKKQKKDYDDYVERIKGISTFQSKAVQSGQELLKIRSKFATEKDVFKTLQRENKAMANYWQNTNKITKGLSNLSTIFDKTGVIGVVEKLSKSLFGLEIPESVMKSWTEFSITTGLTGESLYNLMGVVGTFGMAFNGIASVLKLVGGAFGYLMKKAGGWIFKRVARVAITSLGSALGGLSAPLVLAGAAVGAIVFAIYEMMGGWEGITKTVKSFKDGFMSAMKPAAYYLDEVWKSIKDIGSAFGEVIDQFRGDTGFYDWTEAGKAFGDLFVNWVLPAVKGVADLIAGTFRGIAGIIHAVKTIGDITGEKGIEGWIKETLQVAEGKGPKRINPEKMTIEDPMSQRLFDKISPTAFGDLKVPNIEKASNKIPGNKVVKANQNIQRTKTAPRTTPVPMRMDYANNKDDMSDSIASSITNAMQPAVNAIINAAKNNNIVVNIQGDMKKLFKAVKSDQANSMGNSGVLSHVPGM